MIKDIPWLYRFLKAVQEDLQSIADFAKELDFLIRCHSNLKGTDLLIIAGSQQLNDAYGGPWGFPYTLFKWSILAKLAGTKVAFVSVGAGPVNSPLSSFFLKCALSLANYRSYRDEISSRLVEKMGVKGENPVFPDLVYSLRVTKPSPAPRNHSRAIVGTNPVPFFDGRYWAENDRAIYEDYVRKLAHFADWLVRKGHQVLFFPTQLRADPPVINDIRLKMKGNGKAGGGQLLAGLPIGCLEDLAAEISRTDIVVASRYHGILLAFLLNKPVLALAYHKKSRALMAQVGQAEYILDIDRLDTDRLIERFTSLEARAETVKKEVGERIPALRQALEKQYDRVFQLLETEQVIINQPIRDEPGIRFDE